VWGNPCKEKEEGVIKLKEGQGHEEIESEIDSYVAKSHKKDCEGARRKNEGAILKDFKTKRLPSLI